MLFVERPLQYSDFWKGGRAAASSLALKKVPGRRIHTLRPISPVPWGAHAQNSVKLNQFVHGPLIRAAMRRLGIRRPILWNYHPEAAWYVGSLGERLSFYHCVDDFPAQANLSGRGEMVRTAERQLLDRVDVVAVTSPTLLDRAPRSGEVHLLPNVADTHLFAQARGELPCPSELTDIKRPIIGFWGALDRYKVDFDLLSTMADTHPDMTFLLIGPTGAVDGTLRAHLPSRSNLVYLPGKSQQQLPAYASQCAAFMIPYVHNQYTDSVFPLKVYEYLATGKPVISTRLPSIVSLHNVIDFAEGAHDFGAAVRSAISNDSPKKQAERIALASENSWESRVRSIVEILKGNTKMRGVA